MKIRTYQKHPIKRENGFTIIEAIVALGIAMAVFVAVFAIARVINNNLNTNRTTQGLAQIVTSTKQQWQAIGNYTGVENESIIKSRIIPSTFTVDDKRILHPFDGEVVFTTIAGGSYFQISLAGIPDHACKETVGLLDGDAYYLTINGTVVKNKDETTKRTLDQAATVTACTQETSDIIARIRR